MKIKLLLVCTTAIMIFATSAAQQKVSKSHQIHWHGYSFNTSKAMPNLIPALQVTAYPEDEQRGYYFVQFTGPITSKMKLEVTNTGAELLNYVPDNAFLTRMNSQQRNVVNKLSVVQWVGIYQPAMRISKPISMKLTSKESEEDALVESVLPLILIVFEGENLARITSEIEEAGAKVFNQSEGRNPKILVSVSKENALQLATINGIKWIEEYRMKKQYNDVANGTMGIRPVWNTHGLRGEGQIIAVADNGLDSGIDDNSMHDDFEGRIHSIFSWPVQADQYVTNVDDDDGAADLEDGHGTHVSGSVLGNGQMSGGIYSGVAPRAELVFQALMQECEFIDTHTKANGYYLAGIPSDLNELFQQAYDTNARIHSNSWGMGNPGGYDSFSENVDEFVWDHPDMLIIYAAGNSGSDRDDHDNVIDKGSVSSPGTAKNCLTVGATENDRPSIPQTWRIWYGSLFNSDQVADDPEGMAARSSRGPANAATTRPDDDIIKPDVVAPGTMIVSTRSQATANTIWFQDDMESGANGWTPEGTWTQVDTEAHGGDYSWHDSPGGDYADDLDISLMCPVQDISGGGPGTKFLQFWYKCDLGAGDDVRVVLQGDDNNFDIIVDTATQEEWQLFTRPLGPHLSRIGANCRNWSDDENLQISFRLHSNDDGNTGDGFYVDDIRIVEGAYTTARLSDFGLAPPGSPIDENYLIMGGTSMSTPLVAGAAAIVRQYYTDELDIDYVSAALLRATLINGAVDISPGQYGTGATREIDPRPDNVQGWGRVNLENSIFPADPAKLSHIDELAGLETNESHTYSYTVTDENAPLILTMVYHDAPGVGLVNNLDMTVTSPSLATFYPNGGTSVDNQNNVEQIVISSPETETYTIQIDGQSVPEGPQPYAIAISGSGDLLERDPVDVMLVLDLSGSMLSPACPTCDPKLTVLKDAVELFIVLWSAVAVPDDRVGVNYFKTNISNLTIGSEVLLPVTDNKDDIITDVQNKSNTYSDLTAMGGGLQSAINTLIDELGPKNIILFTDGMQNVNPIVDKIDDGPPGAFHLDIDNVNGKPYSNISPSSPITTLNEDLGIKINTIGVGTSASYIEMLTNIADKTSGLSKITTAPDNDLRRFYVEELIDVLREYSPQLLGYRYGTLSGGMATETFDVNQGISKLMLMCSGKPGVEFSFSVSKDGTNVPLNDATIYGSFYQVFVLDFPNDAGWTSGGEWKMHISGAEGEPYEVAAIIDDHKLDYEISVGEQNLTVGEPFQLDVRLTYDRRPITDAIVKARILRPQIGLGTLLSTSKAPEKVADKFRPEAQSTPGQLKLQKLLSVNSFQQRLIPNETLVELTNNGDGSYSTAFSDTELNGVYSVVFDIEGNHGTAGEYRRTESLSAMFSYGNTVLSESSFFKSLEDETGTGKFYHLHITPIDDYGNYLGPDYGDQIQVSPPSLQSGDIIDETDGSYTIPIQVSNSEDPEITIVVKGDIVYEGKVSQIPDPVEDRFKLSVHGGWAYPTGSLANQYSSGYLLELDFEYMIKPNLSLMAILGRYALGSNYNTTAGALYLNGYFPIKNQAKGYGAFGAGLYKPDNVNLSFGLSGGLGVTGNLSAQILYDIGIYYYNVFAPNNAYLNWAGLRAGIKYKF